jgi:hypothetical protein
LGFFFLDLLLLLLEEEGEGTDADADAGDFRLLCLRVLTIIILYDEKVPLFALCLSSLFQ